MSEAETVDIRVSGQMEIEVILTLPKDQEEKLIAKAELIVRDALKQALNDIEEVEPTVEAYCEAGDLTTEIEV